MSSITIVSYFQLAALLAFAVIFFGRVTATAHAGINPFAFLISKGDGGKAAQTGFLLVTLLLFVEVALEVFSRPFRLLPAWAYTPLDVPVLYPAGVLVVTAAFIVLIRAYFDLGPSWRVGTDPHQPSDLVTSGIYARTRNPIYLFFMLYASGTLLMFPNLVFLVLAVAMLVTVIAVTRQEERFLHATFGATYDDYVNRTPRFVPLLRRQASAVTAVPRRTIERELFTQKTWSGWLQGLLALPPAGRSLSEVILWWERRRLYYNAIVAAFCFLRLGVAALPPASDSLLPGTVIAVLLIVMSNIWYTGGWIAELLLRLIAGDRMLWFAPVMFALGILFSLLFSALLMFSFVPIYIP
jgi:protein-S-isoprenylcysteine O-methyltransferase Ste14